MADLFEVKLIDRIVRHSDQCRRLVAPAHGPAVLAVRPRSMGRRSRALRDVSLPGASVLCHRLPLSDGLAELRVDAGVVDGRGTEYGYEQEPRSCHQEWRP